MPIRSLQEKAQAEAVEAKKIEEQKKKEKKKRKPKEKSWYDDMRDTGAQANWGGGIYISEGLYLYPDGELREG
jgi:hypothetical protein